MAARKSGGGAMLRIGGGAGFAGDRVDPAVALAKHGKLDYLVLECLAERTIALAHQQRRRSPTRGYGASLDARMSALLPLVDATGCRIVTNLGAANPSAAAKRTAAIAQAQGLSLRVAALLGDDVLDLVRDGAGEPRLAPAIMARLVSANAYLGARELRAAVATGADVVICGRVTDSALFLAPAAHHFGWAETDWDLQARGIVLGHLLECAGQITGGYYLDADRKAVPDPARLGFPLAEVSRDGGFTVTKLPGSGGAVSVPIVTEQLLYEVGNPAAYLTPDVTADFTAVELEQIGPDRVHVQGARGAPPPDSYKVVACYDHGFIGEGEISYAGAGAVERARLASEIVRERLSLTGVPCRSLRVDLLGVNALHGDLAPAARPYEVRLRVAADTDDEVAARSVGDEVEALLTNGPAGGGGARGRVRPVLGVAATFLPKALLAGRIRVIEVSGDGE
jgi:Acyclic terpene utilisation family protein AtuA